MTRGSERISQFIQEGNTIEIACSENQESFFKTKFPSLKIHVTLPNNHIQIESGKGLFFKLGLRVFEFRSNWKKENSWLRKHLESNTYDVIYSDNRYGFYHPNVHSVEKKNPALELQAKKKDDLRYLTSRISLDYISIRS